MSVHIIIDGYNLIRQSPTLSVIEHRSLEEGRQALLERLVSYRKAKHHPVTVVFDGAKADLSMEKTTRCKGIDVLFSRRGELADSVIKRFITRERERSVVVTSDKEIALFATQHGAATIDSTEFEYKMETATHNDMDQDGSEEDKGWKPTTKKKGPSRRSSKRQRTSRIKTRKL